MKIDPRARFQYLDGLMWETLECEARRFWQNLPKDLFFG